MKYSHHIDIDLPRDRVIELFDNVDNLYKWMEGLQSFDMISGEQGQEGAQAQLVYKMGKRRIEMVETITKRNLPDEFAGTYEAPGVWNSVQNLFEELGPDKTRWTSNNEFKLKGFIKVIAFVMPGAFKKQSFKYLEMFKAFAEKEGK